MPRLSSGIIEIDGRRNNRWSTISRPALLVVPQAIDRRSQVTLSYPKSLDLLVEAVGMDRQQRVPIALSPETQHPDALQPANKDTTSNQETSVWQFEKPDAGLSLTLRNPERSREFPSMVSLRLRSLLSANPQGFDLYRAQIRLENGSARDELRIRLDPSAVLQQVTIAGQATVPNMQGDELLVADLNAADRDVVELLYRVPSRGGDVRDLHQIVVPQVSATVLAFQWEFALPPSIRIYSEPHGVRLTRSLADSLPGRSAFSGRWDVPATKSSSTRSPRNRGKRCCEPESTLPTSIEDLPPELITPAEWQVYLAVSPVAPPEIWIETWQSTQTRLLAWISLTVSLIIGIVLRMIGWKYRDRVAAYWLGLLLAIAFCAPSPYAEIAGGAIAGTMIALLSPRRSLITPQREPSHMVPLGSTHSFDWGASVGLFLATTWLAVTGFAQDSIAPIAGAAANTGSSQTGNRSTRAKLLVPVDARGNPSSELPLVYLPQQLLNSLREAARTKLPPQSLIASAQYQVTANPSGGDSLQVKFRVHVLDASSGHQILLPIPNAFLTGENACRINGQPHPVLTAPNGKGFIVTWSPILKPSSENVASGQSPTASFDVELDLKRVGVRTARGGSFSTDVPAIAASTLSLTLAGTGRLLRCDGAARGRHRRCRGSSHVRHRLRSRLASGSPVVAESARRQTSTQLKVSQLQFLDLRATNSELKFRIRCEPLPVDGQLDAVDFVDLELPPRCLVREGDIRATNLLRSALITGSTGRQQLRIFFNEPLRQKFSIDGTLLITGATAVGTQSLPQFGPVRSPTLQPSIIQNLWCVNTSPEFRLEYRNLDADLLSAVSPADFFKAWGDSPPTGRHQLIFPQREGPAPVFTITPQMPRRRVVPQDRKGWLQTGQVGKRRLEWTLTAKIETLQAPVYQHILQVDRRLQIESISVMVGGAERRERWSETRHGTSRPRVFLFLKDKTTGSQQLTLKGSLPIRFGRVTPLPFIRCEEIEQVDCRWELYRDPDVDVELALPRGVPAFEPTPEEQATEDSQQLIARYSTADPDSKASIRVSARQARCQARTAAVLTRIKEATWKLTGQLKLVPQGESSRRMGVHFPIAAFDPARVRIDNAEAIWHEPADGVRRLDLTLMPDSDEVTISFDTVSDEPVRGDWELPIPEPQEAISHQVHLLMSPADAWTPFVGTELKPDESPGWATDFVSDLKPDTPTAEYRLDAVPIRLRRQSDVDSSGSA